MNVRAGVIVASLILSAAGCASQRFHDAVERGDTAAVQTLLAADPSLARAERLGRSGGAVLSRPLNRAASNGHLEIVRALLDSGADPNATALRQQTALHEAMNSPAVVALLLERGARIDARDADGNTPLHRAAESSFAEPALALLARGAEVSAVNAVGNTPLHLAAVAGTLQSAAVLCGSGADLAARNAQQQAPHALAGRDDPERAVTLEAWMDPKTGECARLARMATGGRTAPAEARVAAMAAHECAQMQQEQPDPERPARRPSQAHSCAVHGSALEKGEGVEKDESRAAVSYRLSCENGHLNSCARLAVLLEEGRGVRPDPVGAVGYYEKACSTSDFWACTRLGHLLERGAAGLRKDPSAAAALYERSCAGKQVWSCERLARLYEKGTGVARDAARAAQLDAQACALGETDSCARASR